MTEAKFPIRPKPVFITTTNVRNFSVMMKNLDVGRGEERFGVVYGRAGRGKTSTAARWAAHNNAVYIYMRKTWRGSELPFLQTMCLEMGLCDTPPGRKSEAFAKVMDALLQNPRTVILDEIEKLPMFMMEVARDLSILARIPIVMIGEDELPHMVARNRRMMSRTYQRLEFKPAELKDVIIFAMETAGIKLDPQVASIFFQACGGDFRIIRRDILNLVQLCNNRQSVEVDSTLASIAVAQGLQDQKEAVR